MSSSHNPWGMTQEEVLHWAAIGMAVGKAPPPPIDMVLHCPACGLQHIDAAETAGLDVGERPDPDAAPWANPPHKSHLCHGCGHIWRPADVPTNGVAAVKTRGKADSQPPTRAEPTDADIAAIGVACGHATECYGYEHNTLWFDGNLIPFARAVRSWRTT